MDNSTITPISMMDFRRREHPLEHIFKDKDVFLKRFILAMVLGPPGGLKAENRTRTREKQ